MFRRFLTVFLAFGLAAGAEAQTNGVVARPLSNGDVTPSVSNGDVTPLHSVGPTTSLRLAGEALCGPEIVTVGDAWEHVQLEAKAMRTLVGANDLVRLPQKTAALASHLTFMQNRSIMVWGEAQVRLRAEIRRVLDAVPRWNRLALGGEGKALESEFSQLDEMLKVVAAQYPDEALISTNAAALLLPPAPVTVRIEVEGPVVIEVGKEAVVRFHLKTLLGGDEPLEALLITHTKKLHALVLDPLFRDYHHAHPEPTGKPGEYEFRFTPVSEGPYRLWLDVLPAATGREEFPFCDLTPMPNPAPSAPKLSGEEMSALADGFTCELVFPKEVALSNGRSLSTGKLQAGVASDARIIIRDRNGEPVRRLEPTMGAFAHIVGFAEDYKTVLHIHPLGPMPKAGDLGGPLIEFKLRPDVPGDLRLYVQFSVDGVLHLARFAVRVGE